MRRIIRIILIVVFSIVLMFSVYKIYSIQHGYNMGNTLYNGISEQYVSDNSEKDDHYNSPDVVITDTVELAPITVDFDALFNINPDIVGWLYCEGTVINYPIVHGSDNVYYLDHMLDGTYNSCGTLFIDYLNNGDFSDKHTLLYGHHIKNGAMLASITNYSSQEYYDSHPILYLLTPDKDYRIELFSGFTTDPDTDTYKIDFDSDSEFNRYLNQTISNSDFKSNVTVGPEDKIITLSTCSYAYLNARYVVQGKLVELD